MALFKQPNVTAWYCSQTNSGYDLAKDAYENALTFFEQHLTRDDDKRDWMRNQTSMADLFEAVKKARDIHEKSNDSKAHRSITAFASKLQFYGSVLDVLAQHHPEYVALAWGAIKFVFTGVLNHAELVTEISKALTSVGDVLQHVNLGVQLYHTRYMQEAVSRVYAHIMLFLQKAAKWYSMSPARRALSALAKPYSIGYQETVSQIRSCTESFHSVASAGARAELRDQTVLLQDHTTMLREHALILHRLDQNLKDTRDRTRHICDVADATQSKLDQVLHVSEGTYNVANTTLLDVSEQNTRIRDIQFSGVLEALKPVRMPDDVLYACKNVAQRRQLWRTPTQDSARFVQTLNLWINAQMSSLLILQAGLRAEARAKDLALQATTLLKDSRHTVFWYFSERHNEACDLALSDILKSLIFQILTRHPDVVQSEPQLLTISAFKCQHTEQEWLDLLALLLRKVDSCFLVIEMEDLLERLNDTDRATEEILRIFKILADKVQKEDARVKILLVHSGLSDLDDIGGDKDSGAVFTVFIRQPIVPVKRHPSRRRLMFGTAHF